MKSEVSLFGIEGVSNWIVSLRHVMDLSHFYFYLYPSVPVYVSLTNEILVK